MGARHVIVRGSRWLVGDGRALNVWDDKWLPRPLFFKPITTKSDEWANLAVGDLIDCQSATWRIDFVREVFLDCDAELILSIPLYDSWPADKLIWHYHSQGFFSVYHMLISDTMANSGSSSVAVNSLWRAIWRCNVPPCTRLFGWRAAKGILPFAEAISRRVLSFPKGCSICGHMEETDTYGLLECPFASQIWQGCDFDAPPLGHSLLYHC